MRDSDTDIWQREAIKKPAVTIAARVAAIVCTSGIYILIYYI